MNNLSIKADASAEIWHNIEPLAYADAMARMEERVAAVIDGTGKELVWLLEHKPVITLGGITAAPNFLPSGVEIFKSSRGGKATCHMPGQRVVYLVVNLRRNNKEPDLQRYLRNIEQWVIDAMRDVNIECRHDDSYTGVWCADKKIASIGIKVRRWVAYHGVAINVTNSTELFHYMSPCGLDPEVMVSARHIHPAINMEEVDSALLRYLPTLLAAI